MNHQGNDRQPRAEPVAGFVDTPQTRAELEHLDTIAEWLDRRYLDPLLGFFFPGAGNTASSLVGLYGIVVAARLRVHPIIIARMLLNLAIDSLIGSVPLLGWIGDFIFRAHVRNLELLKARGERGDATGFDWFIVLLAAGIFLFALALPVIVLIALIGYLLSTL